MWIILTRMWSIVPTTALLWAMLFGTVVSVSYCSGISHEKTRNKETLAQLESRIKEQENQSNERTRQLIQAYELRIKTARATNGSTRTELTTVRVLDNVCPSTEGTPIEAGPTPSVPVPVVSQTEWERINYARFEEQRLQLEALINWVTTLYRDWSPQ